MEVNPRVQVEHTVTEQVTGLGKNGVEHRDWEFLFMIILISLTVALRRLSM